MLPGAWPVNKKKRDYVVAVYCCVGTIQTCKRPLVFTYMGRECIGQDEHGKNAYRPTITVPSELVPAAPAGAGPRDYYLRQALRIFQAYTGCLLALSSPEAQ
eukprot:15221425-Alexandrium_andersonii.AAC.1